MGEGEHFRKSSGDFAGAIQNPSPAPALESGWLQAFTDGCSRLPSRVVAYLPLTNSMKRGCSACMA
jgi:hypothetical protein